MGITDKVTGKAKQVAGDVTGDSSLRREGRKEEKKGEKKDELRRADQRADEKAEEVACLVADLARGRRGPPGLPVPGRSGPGSDRRARSARATARRVSPPGRPGVNGSDLTGTRRSYVAPGQVLYVSSASTARNQQDS
jgi:uncharacterized protein YjbJ (UPF0337 family)